MELKHVNMSNMDTKEAIEALRSKELENTTTNIEIAREIGLLLIAKKAECKHGTWLPWLATCDISKQQGAKYMSLAKVPSGVLLNATTINEAASAARSKAGTLATKKAKADAVKVGKTAAMKSSPNTEEADTAAKMTEVMVVKTGISEEAGRKAYAKSEKARAAKARKAEDKDDVNKHAAADYAYVIADMSEVEREAFMRILLGKVSLDKMETIINQARR